MANMAEITGLDVLEIQEVTKMMYEANRLNTFLDKGQWPFLKDCNCTPEKMAGAGFFWCGSENKQHLARCFVCLKEFEDWDPNDNPNEEHKRLFPDCPFVKLGKTQDNCTVREVMELWQTSLLNLIDKKAVLQAEQYTANVKIVRDYLESTWNTGTDKNRTI